MPRFEPFRGLRYDAARVDLSMVVAPPYDVIGPEERAWLANRHSANAVRVELPEPDHRAGLDRYDSAAGQLEQWQEEGILVRDRSPALYAYRMTSPGGHATNGVIGALGIDDGSAEAILPHEQTLPKAKTDRLDLLTATRANLSPIWGLSLTAGLTDAFCRSEPPRAEAVGPRRRPPPAVGARGPGRHRSRRNAPWVPPRWSWPTGTTATRRPAPTGERASRRLRRPTGDGPDRRAERGPARGRARSTGPCPACPTGSTWSMPSPRGST